MKRFSIAFALVLTAVAAVGIAGTLSIETIVAAYISTVALTAAMLVLTSRQAPAPVGIVPRRTIRATGEGIVVNAVGGAGRAPVPV